MKQTIQWIPKLVDINKLKYTPNNYKIKNELGLKMLQASLKQFGLAGTIVANTDFVLIDGNSRVKEVREKNKLKKIWVSFPNRKITPKELAHMNAILDQARAGDVDTDRINKELGASSDFYKLYGMQMPLEILEAMGKGAIVEKNGKSKVETVVEELGDNALVPFNMFLTAKQERKFKEWYPLMQSKLRTQTVTETVFKCIELMAKSLKLK